MSGSWAPDPSAEDALLSGGSADRRATEGAFRYLVGSFAAYLGASVEVVWEPRYEDIRPGRWGWSCGIRSVDPVGGPLRLEWYAVLSCGPCRHPEALVLLFAGGDRLVRLPREEYLRFTYRLDPDGVGVWEPDGWESSEMGDEFDGYERLDEVCRQFRAGDG